MREPRIYIGALDLLASKSEPTRGIRSSLSAREELSDAPDQTTRPACGKLRSEWRPNRCARLQPVRNAVLPMMKTKVFSIASIYVPVKRRATLDPGKVQTIAESIMETGQKAPVLVRQDGERFVLVEGLHRLEACRSLGEETILGYLVEARRH